MNSGFSLALGVMALLTSASAVAEPVPADSSARNALSEGVAACATERWSDEDFTARGFQRGTHYSLAAPGQRSQSYDRTGGGDGLSLHSSFILYVACSTGSDIASPDAYPPARDALVAAGSLLAANMAELPLSPNAKAFLKEYDLETATDTYRSNQHLIIFTFRQFDGRNRMAVWTVRLEKEKP